MSHSRQTEHYELPLYDGTDIINPLTDFNDANEAIDEAVYNANQRSVQAENTAEEAKDIAEGYDGRVTQAIQTANDAMTLANNTQGMIAEEFNPMKQGGYNVGDFVIYNGVLYRFINAHTGAWDASDVQVSPVILDAIKDVVEEGKQAIDEAVEEAEEEIAGQTEKVTKTQAIIAQPFDENKVGGYAVNDVVTYADKLYKFTSAHSGAWTGTDVDVVIVENQIAEMKSTFTNGVDTIVNAIEAEGVTLSESTPSACATGVHEVRSKGRQDVDQYNIIVNSDVGSLVAREYSFNVTPNHYYALVILGAIPVTVHPITIKEGASIIGTNSFQLVSGENISSNAQFLFVKSTGENITFNNRAAAGGVYVFVVDIGPAI